MVGNGFSNGIEELLGRCAQSGSKEESGEDKGGDDKELAEGREKTLGVECGVGGVGMECVEDGGPRENGAGLLDYALDSASAKMGDG